MKSGIRLPILIWLVVLMLCGWVVLRHLQVTNDLSAFLPASLNARQALLMDQLHEGVAARTVLIGITNDTPAHLAASSRQLAARLKANPQFVYVNDGDTDLAAADLAFLKRYRYLLSPQVVPGYFSAAHLRQALHDDLEQLASPAGVMLQEMMPADPTGEMNFLANAMLGAGGPHSRNGVWFSQDGSTALLIAQTRAAGFDLAGQQQALQTLHAAFAGQGDQHLLLTGPGIFAAQSKKLIARQSTLLSLGSGVLVALILFFTYRSLLILLLGLVPALSGLLVGMALVQITFGSVHGITLGFAAILMGEAVDYPSYLLTHIQPGEQARAALRHIGPTLRMAVLTTVIGALPMLLSPLSGLAQLGFLAAVGVLIAGLVTQFVMPSLIPPRFAAQGLPDVILHWPVWLQSLPYRRVVVSGLLLAAIGWLGFQGERIWDNNLEHMSPMPAAMNALDHQLRSELGAPDVRYMVAVRGNSDQQVLARSEQAAGVLQQLTRRQVIGRYEAAAEYLPSLATQAQRRAALPDAATLGAALDQAMQGAPFRPGTFTPFLHDVAQARSGPLLTQADLAGTGASLKVQSLLYHKGKGWVALLPLGNVHDPAALRTAVEQMRDPQVMLLDITGESNQMINHYRSATLHLTGVGLLLIAVLLWVGLKRLAVVFHVLFPVLAAVIIEAACLDLLGEQLSIFHLVSILLVIGVGLNYALFFQLAHGTGADNQRTVLSLTVCSLTAFSSFFVLSLSSTPVLHAIGLTVALGVLFSMLIAAWMAPPLGRLTPKHVLP